MDAYAGSINLKLNWSQCLLYNVIVQSVVNSQEVIKLAVCIRKKKYKKVVKQQYMNLKEEVVLLIQSTSALIVMFGAKPIQQKKLWREW